MIFWYLFEFLTFVNEGPTYTYKDAYEILVNFTTEGLKGDRALKPLIILSINPWNHRFITLNFLDYLSISWNWIFIFQEKEEQRKAGKLIAAGKGGKWINPLTGKLTEDEAWMRKKRDAKRDRVYLWQDRTIPYEFAPGLSMNS